MTRICAWCGREMKAEEVIGLIGEKYPVTHGVCEDCAAAMLSGLGERFRDFLDRLGVPVLLVDEKMHTCAGNVHARKLLGKSVQEIRGRLCGEVIECVHSKEPGGCGGTFHCKSCTIRRTATETFKTGKSFYKVPAFADTQCGAGVKALSFLISTEKIGDYVLLQVETIDQAPPASSGLSIPPRLAL